MELLVDDAVDREVGEVVVAVVVDCVLALEDAGGAVGGGRRDDADDEF